MLDGVTTENARLVGGRINKTIQVYDFSVGKSGQSTVVTMSMGLAVASDQDCCEKIYERADKALYKSKAAGRNRLTTISPNEEMEEIGDADLEKLEKEKKISYEEFKASFNES